MLGPTLFAGAREIAVGEPTNEQERRRRSEQKVQRQLDEALADSFPASDPVSIVTSQEEEWDEARAADPPAGPPPAKPSP
jgi:hypothetical protein